MIWCINEVNDTINIWDVISPRFSCSLVSSEIPGFESDFSHDQFFGVGLLGGIHLFHDVLFQTKKEGGFTGIVETEEDDFGIFIHESETFESGLEPVEYPHWVKFK